MDTKELRWISNNVVLNVEFVDAPYKCKNLDDWKSFEDVCVFNVLENNETKMRGNIFWYVCNFCFVI